jgi:hypothetical protein
VLLHPIPLRGKVRRFPIPIPLVAKRLKYVRSKEDVKASHVRGVAKRLSGYIKDVTRGVQL